MFSETCFMETTAARQYEIPPPQITLSWWKKLTAFFAIVFFMFAFRWSIESMFHWKHPGVIEAFIIPVAVAISLAFRSLQKLFPRGGSLLVGDDFIEGRTETGWHTFKKHIRRDQIKVISENRRGLRVMNRGKFGTFMLGCVFVPASLPEYQEIRTVLAQWTPPILA
jgi:hypothetical protein